MKRLVTGLIAAGVLAAGVQASTAADMPRKAIPAAAPAPYSWTGLYLGGNIGWAGTSTDYNSAMVFTGAAPFAVAASVAFINALGSRSADGSGFTGGVQLGYNWQMGAWVFGIEGDFNALSASTSLTGTGVTPGGTPVGLLHSFDPNWLATVRGRIGYAWDRHLLYFTGGAAFLDADFSTTFFNGTLLNTTILRGDATKAGWTIGGGWEWAFMARWSAKVEYLYADFETFTNAGLVGTAALNNPMTNTVDVDMHLVRVGLNYRF
jgi:outer membrane immunogenic protein